MNILNIELEGYDIFYMETWLLHVRYKTVVTWLGDNRWDKPLN